MNVTSTAATFTDAAGKDITKYEMQARSLADRITTLAATDALTDEQYDEVVQAIRDIREQFSASTSVKRLQALAKQVAATVAEAEALLAMQPSEVLVAATEAVAAASMPADEVAALEAE